MWPWVGCWCWMFVQSQLLSVLACFEVSQLHCPLDPSVYMLPPAMASCPLVWGCMGLPSSMGLQPTVAADGWLLHYHRRSHHPSSLTSQCPSSPLSIPERPALLCTGTSPALQCFSPSCSLECTDGPGHAIRPGVGTNTCYRWSLHFNRIINMVKFWGFIDAPDLNKQYQTLLLSKIWLWDLGNRNQLTKLVVGKVGTFFTAFPNYFV